MNIKEFSNEFDVLYNNITSNQAPNLDEYEKSVFLTKAQLEVVKNHFNYKGNRYQEGVDDSTKRQLDFSKLITVVNPLLYNEVSYIKYDDRSIIYKLPNNILFILNESAINIIDNQRCNITIVPISYSEYNRIMNKPYRQPLKNQGWRLLQNHNNNVISEIIIKENTTLENYKIRYIKTPNPIILTDLSTIDISLSIEGNTNPLGCELDEQLHPEILQRAVELAKLYYIGETKSVIELGQRAE